MIWHSRFMFCRTCGLFYWNCTMLSLPYDVNHMCIDDHIKELLLEIICLLFFCCLFQNWNLTTVSLAHLVYQLYASHHSLKNESHHTSGVAVMQNHVGKYQCCSQALLAVAFIINLNPEKSRMLCWLLPWASGQKVCSQELASLFFNRREFQCFPIQHLRTGLPRPPTV